MTTLIIKSDSDKKTLLLMQLAKELGLAAEASSFDELNTKDIALQIGGKVTDGKLFNYLAKGIYDEPIAIDIEFSKGVSDESC